MTRKFNTVHADYDYSNAGYDKGRIGFVATQDIPQDLLDSIKARREHNDRRTFSELTKGDELEQIQIAEIPRIVWDNWVREGFDPHQAMADLGPQAAAQLILAKLRSEDLTAFQLTSKTLH